MKLEVRKNSLGWFVSEVGGNEKCYHKHFDRLTDPIGADYQAYLDLGDGSYKGFYFDTENQAREVLRRLEAQVATVEAPRQPERLSYVVVRNGEPIIVSEEKLEVFIVPIGTGSIKFDYDGVE